MFSDDGYVNKQNCRFGSEDQSEELQKPPMHPEKVTVWCGLCAGGNNGPYFLNDAANRNVNVNGERYREMITNFFMPKCKSLTCMTCGYDKTVPHPTLRDEFGKHFISRLGTVNGPPGSCVLTPLDYFLLGYVKARVYTDKHASIDALEVNIEEKEFVRKSWKKYANFGLSVWTH